MGPPWQGSVRTPEYGGAGRRGQAGGGVPGRLSFRPASPRPPEYPVTLSAPSRRSLGQEAPMPTSPVLPADLLATLAAIHQARRPPLNARYGRAVARRAYQTIRAAQRV